LASDREARRAKRKSQWLVMMIIIVKVRESLICVGREEYPLRVLLREEEPCHHTDMTSKGRMNRKQKAQKKSTKA